MARFLVPGLNQYSYRGSNLSIKLALLLFVLSILTGTIFYAILEGYSFFEAFYMSVITFATVGFQEVKPLDGPGQLFTSIYIIFNIGIYVYAITAFSAYVIKGEIFKTMHLSLIEKKIKELKNHVILCGYGKYGEEISHHFIMHKIPFLIIERDPEKIETIQKSDAKLIYIEDDATHDEVLERAGIDRARAFISALPDDTDNVFTVLTARQLNSKINIISRASDPRSEKKMIKAGANQVIMPEIIGGFYIATLVTKPLAVEFFSFITNEYESDVGFEIIEHEAMRPEYQNKSINDLNIREETGANIIGLKHKSGEYIVNPGPDTMLEKGGSFIILGNVGQLKALGKYLRE